MTFNPQVVKVMRPEQACPHLKPAHIPLPHHPIIAIMSSLATVGLRSARPALKNVRTVGRRYAHADPNYNMPFNYTTVSRRAFAIKAGAFMGFGFAIPFVAIWWGWNRPGGLNNPIN
ncbi:hypothetical protein FA13DRAFT_1797100 [Coprinellus micaceus]|uniref:Uncharacterized protein n=1 Tax=Coprinellus micaceus TaxID=71717 RepID=A0A4Y7SRS2_COPMI|nr:hypothetical protein FA13DRAFT_1797100 [Coprinellus micaceus]